MLQAVFTVCLIAATGFNVFASYVGGGDVAGPVVEADQFGQLTVFTVDVESQNVTGPRLGSPARFLYVGRLYGRIEPGSRMQVFFQGGADLNCGHCGLFVTRIELEDGTVLTGDVDAESEYSRPLLPRSPYVDFWQGVAGICWLVFAIALLIGLRKRPR